MKVISFSVLILYLSILSEFSLFCVETKNRWWYDRDINAQNQNLYFQGPYTAAVKNINLTSFCKGYSPGNLLWVLK